MKKVLLFIFGLCVSINIMFFYNRLIQRKNVFKFEKTIITLRVPLSDAGKDLIDKTGKLLDADLESDNDTIRHIIMNNKYAECMINELMEMKMEKERL
jgi:ribosome maturation protein Sdo1